MLGLMRVFRNDILRYLTMEAALHVFFKARFEGSTSLSNVRQPRRVMDLIDMEVQNRLFLSFKNRKR